MDNQTAYTTYVLIDLENVQLDTDSLARYKGRALKILVFANSNQKLPIDKVRVLQPLGDQVEYIQMSGSGKNALDFFIACRLGQLSQTAPQARIFVISNDTGYDPLIRHLAASGMEVKRTSALTGIKVKQQNTVAVSTQAITSTTVSGTIRQRVIDICASLKTEPVPRNISELAELAKKLFESSGFEDRHIIGLQNFMIKKEIITVDSNNEIIFHPDNTKAGAEGVFVTKASPAPTCLVDGKSLTSKLQQAVCDNLMKRETGKPKTEKTLFNTINTLLKNEAAEKQIKSIFQSMKDKGLIKVDAAGKVTYDLGKF